MKETTNYEYEILIPVRVTACPDSENNWDLNEVTTRYTNEDVSDAWLNLDRKDLRKDDFKGSICLDLFEEGYIDYVSHTDYGDSKLELRYVIAFNRELNAEERESLYRRVIHEANEEESGELITDLDFDIPMPIMGENGSVETENTCESEAVNVCYYTYLDSADLEYKESCVKLIGRPAEKTVVTVPIHFQAFFSHINGRFDLPKCDIWIKVRCDECFRKFFEKERSKYPALESATFKLDHQKDELVFTSDKVANLEGFEHAVMSVVDEYDCETNEDFDLLYSTEITVKNAIIECDGAVRVENKQEKIYYFFEKKEEE